MLSGVSTRRPLLLQLSAPPRFVCRRRRAGPTCEGMGPGLTHSETCGALRGATACLLSPRVWRYMMQNLTVKSVIDVGCGKGVSTSWFKAHGARVQCVEGSSEAVKNSRLPPELVVEHDFSQGSWWPNRTFDAAWSVEFTEHVGRQYMHNYLPIFDSAALIFVSHSHWGGWHHVEVHDNDWWITVRVCWRSNSRHGPPF